MATVLRADGIELRPLTPDDAAEHHAGEDSVAIAAFEFPRASVIEDVVVAITAWQESWAANGPVRNFGIWDASSGVLYGNVELRYNGERVVNLSYLVFPDYRRWGIATRAARLALGYAASEMGAETARIKVLDWNAASLGVARAVGGHDVGREPSEAGGTFVVFEAALPRAAVAG
jgi:RimJ/RimL family protein N-acetyltransferase